MPVALKYDPATGDTTVTITFTGDAHLRDPEKSHLEPGVIAHHLLAVQAAPLCAAAGETALSAPAGGAAAKLTAERAAKVAEVEAQYAAKIAAAAGLTTDLDAKKK